jgi:hypothetical protein
MVLLQTIILWAQNAGLHVDPKTMACRGVLAPELTPALSATPQHPR